MVRGERIRVLEEQPLPETIPLCFTAEVIRPGIAADSQPLIEIRVKNESESAVTYRTGFFEVFGAYESEGTNPGLVILPEEWPVELKRPLRPTDDSLILDSLLCGNTFMPGETARSRRRLWDHPDNSGEVFSDGTYSFSSEYLDADHEVAFEWGFSVEVT